MSKYFEIGTPVFFAAFETQMKKLTCPDCGGTGIIRVILHGGEEVTIECQGCQAGINGPRGYVTVYERGPLVEEGRVDGLRVEGDNVEYIVNGRHLDAEDVFGTVAPARARAAQMTQDYARREAEALAAKERPTRSWSWNASYHRGEIRRAEQSIAYHKSKLAVASLKAREDKKAASTRHLDKCDQYDYFGVK